MIKNLLIEAIKNSFDFFPPCIQEKKSVCVGGVNFNSEKEERKKLPTFVGHYILICIK